MSRSIKLLDSREDAAIKLIDAIPMQKLKDEQWRLVGISKGGLELAYQIRARLKNQIDFLFSEGINAPKNVKCEIARVSENEQIVIDEKLIESFEIKHDYIYGEAKRKYEEKILSYIYQYRKGRTFFDVKNKIVLLVDDGANTGMKFMLAIKSIMSMKPKALYIAVPVIPTDVLELLDSFSNEIYFLHSIDHFVETGFYYKELQNISEDRVEKILGEKYEV